MTKRLAGFGSILVLGLAILAALPSDSWAQACAGPAAPGVAAPPVVATVLFPQGPNGIGNNLVEIPAFSPINAGGGFPMICAVFGLAVGSSIAQFNAQTGTITTH